ncbi:MAG: hypothetical protein R3C49_17455 [Planctomycetaceae bacterium]
MLSGRREGVASIAPPATQTAMPVSETQIAADGLSVAVRQKISDYSELCRPRIAVMTLVAVAVGFTVASPIVFDVRLLATSLVGICFWWRPPAF